MPTDPREPERTDFDARFAEIISQLDDAALEKSALSPEPEKPSPVDTTGDSTPPPHGSHAAKPADESVPTEPPSADRHVQPPRVDPPPERPREPPADPIADLPAQWRMPTGEPAPMLEDDGHFEPEPPQPLPAGDLNFWAILGSLIGGPLWLLYLLFFDRYARPMWWLMACGLCVAGVVLLIMRQPHSRDDLDEDDDGARL